MTTLNEVQTKFIERSPNFGSSCVQFKNVSGSLTAEFFDDCNGINESAETERHFCLMFNNSMVQDTLFGEAQMIYEGYAGDKMVDIACNQGPQYFMTNYVRLPNSDNESDCLYSCMMFRINPNFFDAYMYCCLYNTINTKCFMFGENDPSANIANSIMPVSGIIIYMDIIPYNLREWDKGSVRMSSQCQGSEIELKYQVNLANTIQLERIGYCFTEFKNWVKNQSAISVYCAEYRHNIGTCTYFSKSDKTPKTADINMKPHFTLTQESSPCLIEIQNHSASGSNEAEISQGSCFTIDPVILRDKCQNESIAYHLTDTLDQELTEYFLYIETESTGGKIHVCPKDLRTSSNLTFMLHASLGTANSYSREFTIIMKETLVEGFHGEEGKRIVGKRCEGHDFHKDQEFPNSDDELECLDHCLNFISWWSLQCCEYWVQTSMCNLMVSDQTVTSRENTVNDTESEVITNQGFTPKDQNYSKDDWGGWKWDAYCSGTFLKQETWEQTPIHLMDCQQWFYQETEASCAQYQGDQQICTLFTDCDPSVGNLDGFFCYNPAFQELEFIFLNQLQSQTNLPSQNFTVGQEQAFYEFPAFVCIDCNKEVVYEIIDIRYEVINETDTSTFLQLNQTLSNSSLLQIKVDTTIEVTFQFKIFAYLEDDQDTNTTSNEISFFILALEESQEEIQEELLEETQEPPIQVTQVDQSVINSPPKFVSEIPDEILVDHLFAENEGFTYTLPEIWDENGQNLVDLILKGLDESVIFDQETNELEFSNLTETKNVTVEITLTDLEGKSTKATLKFVFEIQQIIETEEYESEIQSNFAGVDVESVDQAMKESQENIIKVGDQNKNEGFEIEISKFSLDGLITVLFEEDLFIPREIYEIDAKIGKRELEAIDDGQQSSNNTDQILLNKYLESVLNVKALRYDPGLKKHVDKKIGFDLIFKDWTEQSINMLLNFSRPLQISQGQVPDRVVLEIIDPSAFISKSTNATLNLKALNLESLIFEIPKQLLPGSSEKEIKENIEQAKTAQLAILIIQCICQSIMQGSQRKTMHFFLTIQFISFTFFYSVELPTIPLLILKEMQNLVMLAMFKPENIYILLKSLGNKVKNEKSFIDIYEQNQRLVEKSDGLIKEVSSASSIIILFAFSMIVASSLLVCKKTRTMIKEQFNAYKRKMVWNGLIIFLEMSFIQYCHQFLKIIQNNMVDSEKWEESQKGIVVIRLLLCICTVFISQSLVFAKLLKTESQDLVSSQFIEKLGELTKDIKVRPYIKFEKYMYCFMSILKAILVLATAFQSQFTQLLIINVCICIYFSLTLTLRPYDISKKDQKLRNGVMYLKSLWFMVLPLFIGRFIDSDDEEAEIQEMVFEGFLSDEYLHYEMGGVLIYLQIAIVSLLIAIIVKDMVKNFTQKRFQFAKKYWLAKQSRKESFEEEVAERTKYKFLIVKRRGDRKLELVPQYLDYLSRFDGELSKDHLLDKNKNVKLSQVHAQRQKHIRNDHRLNQIRCTQMRLVLNFGQFKMTEKKFDQRISIWRAEILCLKKEQQQLFFQGFGDGETFEEYFLKFERDYAQLSVNEVCDLLNLEMKEQNIEIPSVKKIKTLELEEQSSSSESSSSSSESSSSSVSQSQKEEQKIQDLKTTQNKESKVNFFQELQQIDQIQEKSVGQDLKIIEKDADDNSKTLIPVKTKGVTPVSNKILKTVEEEDDEEIFIASLITESWAKERIKEHILKNMKFDSHDFKEFVRILRELPIEKANLISRREALLSFGILDDSECLHKSKVLKKQKAQILDFWEKKAKLSYGDYVRFLIELQEDQSLKKVVAGKSKRINKLLDFLQNDPELNNPVLDLDESDEERVFNSKLESQFREPITQPPLQRSHLVQFKQSRPSLLRNFNSKQKGLYEKKERDTFITSSQFIPIAPPPGSMNQIVKNYRKDKISQPPNFPRNNARRLPDMRVEMRFEDDETFQLQSELMNDIDDLLKQGELSLRR